MTSPESSSPVIPEVGPDLKALQESYQTLRSQFQAALVAVVVLAFSVDLYLWKQASLTRRQEVELSQIITDYEKNGAPKMNEFMNNLREYSRIHPEIKPILAKYMTNLPVSGPLPTNLPAKK